MSPSDPSEEVCDAFDRLLEARFKGKDLDPGVIPGLDPAEVQEIQEVSRVVDEVLAGAEGSPHLLFPGYRLLKEIGHGGMGTVYLAEQQGLARRVAIKVLSPSLAYSRRSRRRFLAEAKALARLRHDHVVAVHDIFFQEKVLAYAMEWVEGRSLQQVLAVFRQEGLSPKDVTLRDLARVLGVDEGRLESKTPLQFWLQVGISIARALQAVHEAGIIHRDVKPGNILIRRNGQALLSDFGLARSEETSLSQSRGFVGTPIYAAPELLAEDAGEPSPRSDIYSLAVTLYEVATGTPPFRGSTTASVLLRISRGRAERLRKAAPKVPRDLELVLEKAMALDPAVRYEDAGAFADDLERILRLEPVRAKPPSLAQKGGRWLRRNRRLVLGAVVGAALVFSGFQGWRIREEARRDQRHRAALLQHAAHMQLLLPEVRKATWLDLLRKKIQPSAFERAQELRRSALASYQKAMELEEDPSLEVEEEALDLVLHLPEFLKHPISKEALEIRYPSLGPLHPLVLRSLIRPVLFPFSNPRTKAQLPRFMPVRLRFSSSPSSGEESPSKLSPEDLERARTWGLLGFLAGAGQICEDSWRVLEQRGKRGGLDLPFLDVALSQIYKEDGRWALALLHLQRAIRLFPGLEDLKLDMAEIAIELGDDQEALQILRGLPPKPKEDLRWEALRARALALRHPERARPQLLSLLDRAPGDPSLLLALARLDYGLGRNRDAVHRLRILLRRFPHKTSYRLAMARAALRLQDADLFLEQVRYAMQVRFGLFRSRGQIRDLLDLLQLGGLRRVYAYAVQQRGRYGSRDITGVSDRFWEGRPPWNSREALETALLRELGSSKKK